MSDAYTRIMEIIREAGTLSSAQEVLGWDQEVFMPPGAVHARADQMSLLASRIHELWTSPEMVELLASLEGQDPTGDPVVDTNLREIKRDHHRAVRIPSELVQELARVSTLAKEAWANARKENDFSLFCPHLERLVALRRETANLIGFKDDPYDALLDEFEPGATTAEIDRTFTALRKELVPLVQRIRDCGRKPETNFLKGPYPKDKQHAFGLKLAEDMGFDFNRGRLDVSTHPFTSGSTPLDVRLTTRYDEAFLPMSIFGTMHEVGHGLYEQGLNPDHRYTPMGESVSLGIHESQSRLWENLVGRSKSFWEGYIKNLQTAFTDVLGFVSVDAFYAAINTVNPTMIRVEADEVTYNLHIILRFQIECDLINQRIEVKDIPESWNIGMQSLLGIEPKTDTEGCLQDIHWSMGCFGYFPTYTLGNLYASAFFDAAKKGIPGLEKSIRLGDFKPLLTWLREKIHQHGRQYSASELVRNVTGSPLSAVPFTNYLKNKYGDLYGI